MKLENLKEIEVFIVLLTKIKPNEVNHLNRPKTPEEIECVT